MICMSFASLPILGSPTRAALVAGIRSSAIRSSKILSQRIIDFAEARQLLYRRHLLIIACSS